MSAPQSILNPHLNLTEWSNPTDRLSSQHRPLIGCPQELALQNIEPEQTSYTCKPFLDLTPSWSQSTSMSWRKQQMKPARQPRSRCQRLGDSLLPPHSLQQSLHSTCQDVGLLSTRPFLGLFFEPLLDWSECKDDQADLHQTTYIVPCSTVGFVSVLPCVSGPEQYMEQQLPLAGSRLAYTLPSTGPCQHE